MFSTATLDEGHIGGPVLLGEDRIVIVKDLEHHKAAPQPLAEVHEVIIAAIMKERGSAGRAEGGEQRARSSSTAAPSFDAVLHGLGVTADPAHFVGPQRSVRARADPRGRLSRAEACEWQAHLSWRCR